MGWKTFVFYRETGRWFVFYVVAYECTSFRVDFVFFQTSHTCPPSLIYSVQARRHLPFSAVHRVASHKSSVPAPKYCHHPLLPQVLQPPTPPTLVTNTTTPTTTSHNQLLSNTDTSSITAIVRPSQDLTMAAVGDLSRFPLLDSFHWEILRMFPAPPFYCKVSVPPRLPLQITRGVLQVSTDVLFLRGNFQEGFARLRRDF